MDARPRRRPSRLRLVPAAVPAAVFAAVLMLPAATLGGCTSTSGNAPAASSPTHPATTGTPATPSAATPATATSGPTTGASSGATSVTTPGELPGRWAALAASPLPALTEATGAWSGTELIVVGEVSGAAARPVGYAAAYDPATGRWRRLPTPSGSRAKVEGHPHAVWTGRDLVVWGGDFFDAYTPATNSWRRLPTPAGVPRGDGFAMVWTGRVLVLYGGGCCGGPDSGGASLDPVTGTWTPLPPGPLGARWTSGAWTGTEVVVAGGVGPAAPGDLDVVDLATAAAWNPVTRRWRSLPDLPVAGRGEAVWDGARVLVLGPRVAAAYSPATNTWTALPAGYDARDGAGAAWTGHLLLVWGGHVTSPGTAAAALPAHGLGYDPVAHRWTALPTSPLRGRYAPVVGWTGTQFLVWGGTGESTGAAFTPSPAPAG
jgi:hypothetical protein